MKRRSGGGKPLILDACVLIDFLQTDSSVIKVLAEYIGPLYVTSTLIGEINDITDESDFVELGLLVVEPEIEDAFSVSTDGPLSMQDQLCLLTAKRAGFTCITNDKNLRRLCEKEGVQIMWGLELIAELHKAGGITNKYAERLARAISESNPMHITPEIVSRFMDRIKTQEA